MHALLREVSAVKRLGVAWYLYPDPISSGDDRHGRYLDQPVERLSLSLIPYSTVNGGARDISPFAFSRSEISP